MRTKIFFAFIIVIFSALLSNFIFEYLIIRDFDSYTESVKEDQFNWVLASVEGNYSDSGWDKEVLAESIHWGMMLGLDMKVLDASGREVLTSHEAMASLSDTMKKRMEGLSHVHMGEGGFEEHSVVIKGERIGTVLARPFQKELLKEKETAFKKRTQYFLYISFLIAGIGSVLIAFLLSRYLSRPITELKVAADRIAGGDFAVRMFPRSMDEVGVLSESFNEMAESLKREEELRKHLMANVAHELRTPLTIMKTQIEAIADGVVDTEKGLENIRNENERLIRLVKGIEDITAAEASFFGEMEEIEINLKKFLSALIDEMLPAFGERGLEIRLINSDDIRIVSDVGKLEKIIRNIISNALKFTEKGGVWVDYGISENDFFVEIRDSGRGIPEEELPLIFDRYYRLERTKSGGLGLGLAIVKELITVLGGRIEVKSVMGAGTTFKMFIPSKPA